MQLLSSNVTVFFWEIEKVFSSFVLFERKCHRNIYIQLTIFRIRVER